MHSQQNIYILKKKRQRHVFCSFMHYALHVSNLVVPCQELSCCWYVDIKAAIFTNTVRQQQGTSDIGSHVKMCQKASTEPSKTPSNEPEGFKDAGHSAKSCNRHNNVDWMVRKVTYLRQCNVSEYKTSTQSSD